MESTNNTKIIIAIAIQLLIILLMIIYKFSILAGGYPVLLRIDPVDPRDPLRGDYITFQYTNLSNIDSWIGNSANFRDGDSIYVTLEREGKYWVVSGVSKKIPEDGKVFIKGILIAGGTNSDNIEFRRNSELKVIYSIEEYFIPEGAGRDFSFWSKEVSAEVMINNLGDAVLKQVYVDDKPWP